MIDKLRTSAAAADMADWVTVAAYLLAAVLCARAARHAWLRRQPRDRMFWLIATVLLILFAINEPVDLQTLLTSLGRAHAQANGWYEERRTVQFAFVVILGVTALLAGIVMVLLTRRTHATVRLGLAGLGFIGLFVLFRAASFHHLDEILGRGAPEFNWGSLQEMAGILIVAAAAALYSRTGTERR